MVSALLLISAVIHLLPLSGVISTGRLAALYGVVIVDPNLALAMRHRAVMFGLLGVLLAAAAFAPELRPVALLGGLLSDAAFMGLALSIPGTNDRMRRVLVADVISVVCLLGAAGLA